MCCKAPLPVFIYLYQRAVSAACSSPILASPGTWLPVAQKLVGFWSVVFATSKVISGWLNSAAPLENQATGIITLYPSQSQYPGTELTSLFPFLLMPNTWLGSYMYQFYKSLVWLDWKSDSRSFARIVRVLPIRPPHLGSDPLNNFVIANPWQTIFCVCSFHIMSEWIERLSPLLVDRGIRIHGFESHDLPMTYQLNQWLKNIDICSFLVRLSALIG